MLKDAYLDAKIGVDPAENEPPKAQQAVAPRLELTRTGRRGVRGPTAWRLRRGLDRIPRFEVCGPGEGEKV